MILSTALLLLIMQESKIFRLAGHHVNSRTFMEISYQSKKNGSFIYVMNESEEIVKQDVFLILVARLFVSITLHTIISHSV